VAWLDVWHGGAGLRLALSRIPIFLIARKRGARGTPQPGFPSYIIGRDATLSPLLARGGPVPTRRLGLFWGEQRKRR